MKNVPFTALLGHLFMEQCMDFQINHQSEMVFENFEVLVLKSLGLNNHAVIIFLIRQADKQLQNCTFYLASIPVPYCFEDLMRQC